MRMIMALSIFTTFSIAALAWESAEKRIAMVQQESLH